MDLRPDVAASVQSAINRATTGWGKIAALPAFKEDCRTARKDRAHSVVAEAMQAWLSSDEAAAWRNNRTAIFSDQALAMSTA